MHGISKGSSTAANKLRLCQVAELEAEQVRLQTHCAEVEASCKLLHKEVAEVRGQWQRSVADNSRLKTELHYQRNNVQLGLGMQVKIAATAGVLRKHMVAPSHEILPDACAHSPDVCLGNWPAAVNPVTLPCVT